MEGHGRRPREDGGETGVRCHGAERQEHQNLDKTRKDLPGAPGGAGVALLTPWVQTSGFRSCKTTDSCCFKPPVCYTSPKEGIEVASMS